MLSEGCILRLFSAGRYVPSFGCTYEYSHPVMMFHGCTDAPEGHWVRSRARQVSAAK